MAAGFDLQARMQITASNKVQKAQSRIKDDFADRDCTMTTPEPIEIYMVRWENVTRLSLACGTAWRGGRQAKKATIFLPIQFQTD
jgi:hypothetical protein